MGCSVGTCSSVVFSLGCRVAAYFAGALSRHCMGISPPVPGAPLPIPSLTLVFAEVFLTLLSLSCFTGLLWFCSFLITNPQRCCLCGQRPQPCPVVVAWSHLELAMSSPGQSQPPITDPQAAPKVWAQTACSVN